MTTRRRERIAAAIHLDVDLRLMPLCYRHCWIVERVNETFEKG